MNEEEKQQDEFIYVKLDKKRELRYGFKAMKLLEQAYDNKPFLELIEKLGDDLTDSKMTIDQILFLVYVGLIRDDKEMTLERTTELLEESEYDIRTIADLLMKIFQAFLGASPPQTKEDLAKKAKSVALAMKMADSLVESAKAASGTGASSGKQHTDSSDGQKNISGTQHRENMSKRSKGKKKKKK